MSTTSPTPQSKPGQPTQPAPAAKASPAKAPAPAPSAAAAKNPTPDPKKKSSGSFLVFLVLGLIVLAAVVYYLGIAPRAVAKTQLDQEQKISMDRRVVYVPAHTAIPTTELALPGSINAFQQASIFARTTGYVKKWNVDIGDIVHEGDPLAELDTPEVDHQLSQAQAQAEQARAAADIAQTDADRWASMGKDHSVSQEEIDTKMATLKEAKATLDADLANVQQLTATQNFKHIVAPFTGTVTFRHIEVGNLVSSGTGTAATGTSELFRVAQIDPVRVFIDVPEANTRSIQQGVKANIRVQAYPDRVFEGTVVRSAGALDNASRTLRTEIDVPNHDGALLPGTYADVRLELVDKTPAVLIPANTLIVNAAGPQVAMLEPTGDADSNHFKVHLLPVKVGRDFGTSVEILQNVKDGDLLVTNPPSDITDGMAVTGKLLPPPPAPAPPANTPQKS